MISKDEILRYARSLHLDPSMVEKDYVLGWVLIGIRKHYPAHPTVGLQRRHMPQKVLF